MALIRRSPSNLSKIPGTTSLSTVTGGLNIKQTTGVLNQVTADFAAKGGNVNTNLQLPSIRNKQVFEPTTAQKSVITPQQLIGGQIITVEKVTGDYQTGQINVEYSQKPVSSLGAQKQAPIVKTVANAGQATALSRLLGRTVQAGEGLTAADINRINTPGAAYASQGVSGGFTGGAGYGQLFPINEKEFELAQKAVDIQRVKSLAVKTGFSVSTSPDVKKQISFQAVMPSTYASNIVRPTATPSLAIPKKTVKDLSLAIQGFYK